LVVGTQGLILVMDVGNTRVGCALFQRGEIVNRWHVPTSLSRNVAYYQASMRLEMSTRAIDPDEVQAVVLCSVVPMVTEALQEMVRNLIGEEAVLIHRESRLPIRVPEEKFPTIGPDRLVAAAMAYHLVRRCVIVIDSGTATTLDAVSARGEFLGGVILPGTRMWLNALRTQTAMLPLIQPQRPKNVLGETTTEAINAGLSFGYPEIVRGLAQQIEQELKRRGEDTPAIFLTGGSANEWHHALPDWDYRPDFLLHGLHQAYLWSRD
jgi:type III pantothenate kinase